MVDLKRVPKVGKRIKTQNCINSLNYSPVRLTMIFNIDNHPNVLGITRVNSFLMSKTNISKYNKNCQK